MGLWGGVIRIFFPLKKMPEIEKNGKKVKTWEFWVSCILEIRYEKKFEGHFMKKNFFPLSKDFPISDRVKYEHFAMFWMVVNYIVISHFKKTLKKENQKVQVHFKIPYILEKNPD